ncbi:MAG: energy transducer TonB [Vulcanimicrobiaceae bacterium]
MHPRIWLTAGVCAIALAAPGLASAQEAGSYQPPKLLRQGTATSAVGGPGTVKVKVEVDAAGHPTVSGIISSTNHSDEQAAIEIAKTSSYRPALKDGKPILAYYDFELKFNGTSVALGGGPSGSLASYEMMTRAGNYKGARSGLQSYVGQHPADERAQLDLAIAETYLNRYGDAAAAFDTSGTVPDNTKAIAAKAYSEDSLAHYKAKSFDTGIAEAKRAADLAPSYATYNALGFGEFSKGDFTSAIADLEKARAQAASQRAAAHERAVIDDNLASAYAESGNVDAAKPVAAEAAALAPGDTQGQIAIANSYVKKAQALAQSGKHADAAAVFEQAAQQVPSQAAALYAQAAVAYLNAQPSPLNDKAKADADKALAVDPDSAVANYAAGVALGNQAGHEKDALVYLQKADASAKKAGDTNLSSSIEKAIAQLNGTH